MDCSIGLGDAATWVAAGISFFSAFVSVWWPWRNRPIADWIAENHVFVESAPLSETQKELDAWVAVNGYDHGYNAVDMINCGDGSAYNVTVEGIGCRIRVLSRESTLHSSGNISEVDMVSVVRSSEFVRCIVCPDQDSGAVAYVIRWTPSPVRTRTRLKRTIVVRGSDVRLPSRPVSERTRGNPSMLRYRVEGLFPRRFVCRFSGLFRTRDPRLEEKPSKGK